MTTTKFLTVLSILALAIIAACGGQAVATADQIPSSPDGTIRFVAEKIADGHPEVVWEALPQTYQKDINDLTHLFAAKVDKEVWDKSFVVLRKTAVVLQDKKDLFLGSQMFAMAEDSQDEIAENWDTAALVLSTLVNSDLGNLESMETINWGHFMATTGKELMEVAKKASAATEENAFETDFLAKVRGMEIEVLEKTDTTAKLKISAPDEEPDEEPEEVEMTKVEGRWVPTDMAKDWDKRVVEARTKLEEITPETIAQQKMQIMMMVGMAEAFVDQVAQAKTSEELDQMLQGLLGGLLGGAMGGPPAEADAPAE